MYDEDENVVEDDGFEDGDPDIGDIGKEGFEDEEDSYDPDDRYH